MVHHANASGRNGPTLLALLPLLLLLAVAPARASENGFLINNVQTHLDDGVFLLDADIRYRLGERASAALKSGIPITIDMEITIERQRRWWFNDEVAELTQRYQLYYHALSHRYLLFNLNTSAFDTFYTLPALLDQLGWIRNFPLIDEKLIDPEERYELHLQSSIDVESLPAPLRPIAYLNSDWHLTSDELVWPLRP